jgi:hypothetical protein
VTGSVGLWTTLLAKRLSYARRRLGERILQRAALASPHTIV